jgi:hypothetical protein
MTQANETDSALRALRDQIHQLQDRMDATERTQRHAPVAASLAGALLALTATTWFTDRHDKSVHTLWGSVGDAGGLVVLLILLAIPTWSLTIVVGNRPNRWPHIVQVVLGLLAAGFLLLVGLASERHASTHPAMTGLWVSALLYIALATTHGSWIGRDSQLDTNFVSTSAQRRI